MAFLLRRVLLFASLLLLSCLFLFGMMSKYLNMEWEQMLPSYFQADSASSTLPTSAPSLVTSSPLEVEEVSALKKLIAWPEPQRTLTFSTSTSPKNCDYRILNPKANYSVGETVEVVLTARDHKNIPKAYGGDFFRAKLHSPKLKAGVTGSVNDHQNGSYTFAFFLAWPGNVEISIQLIHSSEAVHIMKRLRDSRPDKYFYRGHFRRNGTTEITECNLDIRNKTVCEYQDLRTREKWVCVKPKMLPCSAYVLHSTGALKRITTKDEDAFFHRSVTKQIITPRQIQSLHVISEINTIYTKKLQTCVPGLKIPKPSGFYYNDVWNSLVCKNKRFSTAPEAITCLKGKIIYMFGDSTLRQWWQYIVNFVPSLRSINLHVSPNSGPILATDAVNGILLQWRAHGRPLRMPGTMVANLHYMANDIADIGGGPGVVIALNLWAHFTHSPVETYIQRVTNIRKAIIELLERSPQTTVIIKTANTGHIHGSNWLSEQLDLILRKMFSGIPVAVVDAWETTSCHYLNENIHPGDVIIRNQVDMFLSFICPI